MTLRVQAGRSLTGFAALIIASCASSGREATAPANTASPAAPVSDAPMFQNPIIPGFHPDPSVCRVGDDYYLVTSSFEYFPGVPIFHSKDLTHWRQIGHVLTRASQLPLQGAGSSKGIFAPTIRHHDGTFYVVTTNISGGGSFFVSATDPAGPWSEPTYLSEPDFTMDPSLFFDDDGKVYYTRHGGGERGGAYQAELDLKTGRFAEPPKPIWAGTGGVWPEGPHLYKIKGTYYLLIAEGGTSYNHAITIARSASPWGPFEAYANNPILTHRERRDHPIQATGHADLVQTPTGDWWTVFLGIRPPDGKHHHLGRETFLAPVTWRADGWPVINAGAPVDLQMPRAGLPAPHPWPTPAARDDFDAKALGFEWNFLRNPRDTDWSLSARPGFLRLNGHAASLNDVASPAFVARRQEHLRARAATHLDFEPTGEGQRAGLTLRANEENHYDLAITRRGSARRIELETRIKGVSTRLASEPLPAGPIVLSIEAHPDRYVFSYALASARETEAPRVLGTAPTEHLSSESAGGFTGVYFGLYATSPNNTAPSGAAPPADFDWFEYRPD